MVSWTSLYTKFTVLENFWTIGKFFFNEQYFVIIYVPLDWLCPHFYAPPPPLKKEGHIALHMSVGRYVGIP